MTTPVGWQVGVVFFCVMLAWNGPRFWRAWKEWKRTEWPNWKTRYIVWKRNRNAPKEAARLAAQSIAHSNAHMAAVAATAAQGIEFKSAHFQAGARTLCVGDTLNISWPLFVNKSPATGLPNFMFEFSITRTGPSMFEIVIPHTATSVVTGSVPNPEPPPPPIPTEMDELLAKRRASSKW